MNLHWIDWAMILLPLTTVLGAALYTRKYVRGVSDYISAGRCAGRYLLTSAAGEAGSGVTNTVANVEKFMVAGFVMMFWEGMITPIALLLAICGFVIYRYRQTRVLTLAQFFEERYSRRFRLFIGWILFLTGGIGYIVFPLASCLFFKAFLGLPDYFQVMGLSVPTNVAIMGTYLAITVTMIAFGGQVTLMITDCLEGVFSHLAYIIIIMAIFSVVSWAQVTDVLCGTLRGMAPGDVSPPIIATAPKHSLVDPFDAFMVQDFNFWATLTSVFATIYLYGAGQGGHGFRSAARTPHEGRMAGILGMWRTYARTLMIMVVAIGAITFLRHPDFAEQTIALKAKIAAVASPSGERIPEMGATNPIGSQPWIERKRVAVRADGTLEHGRKLLTKDGKELPTEALERQKKQAPFMALSQILPVGVKGLFLVVMLMGLFAGDGNHIISWSSILVQDCIMPLRKKALSAGSHLNLLRWAAAGMAIMGFVGALILPLNVSIWVWWSVTGAIYNGGAGAILIGGLYWRRGTVEAAWITMIVSAILGLSCVVVTNNWWGTHTALVERGWPEGLISGFIPGFVVMLVSIVLYVVISLATCKSPFDLKRLLSQAQQHHEDETVKPRKQSWLQRILGIDEHFTRGDRWIAMSVFVYSLSMSCLVGVMAFWRYVLPRLLNTMGHPELVQVVSMSKQAWVNLWLVVGLAIPGCIAVVTLFWFFVGSYFDLRRFFVDSANRIIEDDDNGMVRKEAGH